MLPDFIGTTTTLILLTLSLVAIPIVRPDSVLVYQVGGWEPPIGIVMVLDGLTGFMLVTVNLIAFAIAVYSRMPW
jgi:multicomponent Na+:H+ antiporter subunit D